MTIAQRIELRRLGYSKDEVAEMIEQERVEAKVMGEPVETATETEPAPTPVEPVIESATANQPTTADLLAAINNLTTALQMQRIATTPQPAAAVKPQTADDIIKGMLN